MGEVVQMQCLLLYSPLLALGNPTVGSLDIDGAELQVLGTIPWDKVDISELYLLRLNLLEMSSKARSETSSTCSQAREALELGGQRRQSDR